MIVFRKWLLGSLAAGWLSSVAVTFAQAQADLPATPVAQLTRPSGWQLVGAVAAGPGSGSLKTQPGTTILTGTREPLTLLKPTDDFRMRFDVLMTANSDVLLTLPSGQPISFAHSLDLPRLSKAPGLWQTVEVWYKMGGPKENDILEKLVLNGVTVREGQILSGRTANAVTLMDKNGTVAVRNVGSRTMMPRDVARWSGPVSYTIVEGGYIQDPAEAARKKVLKQDTTALLNYEVAYGQPRQYTLLFNGKLNALQAGEYQFDLNQGGVAALWVDGKEVIPVSHRELGQSSSGNVTLSAGPHDVKVYFSRSWFRPGLGLFVSQAGTRPQPLHALASLPEPDPVGAISVQAKARPELIRSFVQVPGETKKRTHSLSVGTPAGMHYTLDLNQMALLQVWKGDFANATEMWYERGEPQLLSPLGVTVHLPAQTALMTLNDENAAWPDSADENTLQYKGLMVGKDGMPTVEYGLAGATVTETIRPEGNALVRTLALKGEPRGTIYCRLVAGALEEVEKGVYAINDRRYYVRFDPKAKAKLRQVAGKQELLLPVVLKNGAGSVQYSIVF